MQKNREHLILTSFSPVTNIVFSVIFIWTNKLMMWRKSSCVATFKMRKQSNRNI